MSKKYPWYIKGKLILEPETIMEIAFISLGQILLNHVYWVLVGNIG